MRAISAHVDYACAMHAWYERPYFFMKKKVPDHIMIHIMKSSFLFETIVVHQRSYAPLLQGLVLYSHYRSHSSAPGFLMDASVSDGIRRSRSLVLQLDVSSSDSGNDSSDSDSGVVQLIGR